MAKRKRADPVKPKKGKAKAAKPSGKAGVNPPLAKGAPPVSPLAPAAFPELPLVDGVRFAAAAAGVRYPDRLDVMLAEIAPGAAIAGVFTRSATRAAPVLWCEECLAGLGVRSDGGFGIVVNSGNANAFNGAAGPAAVEATAKAAAKALGVAKAQVFVASTGVIGEALPVKRITGCLAALAADLSADAAALAARAILTTDTYPKGAGARVMLDGVEVAIAGFAKGSGMIAPDMATMLAFVFTDAAVEPRVFQTMVARETDRSFNCITVDGDTSTSDTVLVAATGRAAMAPIRSTRDPRAPAFQQALGAVMRDLAHQIVRDGEGATK